MADIARLAGVSVSTVSRALADSPRLPEITKKRIADIAGEQDYRVDLTARNFRLKNSDTVVALIPFGADSDRPISDPFYLEIIGVMINAFSARSFDFLISKAQAGDEEWYERYVLGKRVAGLIVLGRKTDDRGIAKLQKAEANFVVWGPPLRGQRYVSVGSDGVSGTREAVCHLADQGRRRIAFVGGDADATETILRQRGYVRGLDDKGLSFDPDLVAYTNYTPRAAEIAVRKLYARRPNIDGIFVCSDLMAVVAMDTVRRLGRSVPGDVSVVGYDDMPLAAHSTPPLTTVRQDIQAGGALLADRLLQQLAGEKATSVRIPTQLVIRESCGAALTDQDKT